MTYVTKSSIASTIGTAVSLAGTAIQADEILSWISLGITILGGIISIISGIIALVKKFKTSTVSVSDVAALVDTVQDSVNSVAEAVNAKIEENSTNDTSGN